MIWVLLQHTDLTLVQEWLQLFLFFIFLTSSEINSVFSFLSFSVWHPFFNKNNQLSEDSWSYAYCLLHSHHTICHSTYQTLAILRRLSSYAPRLLCIWGSHQPLCPGSLANQAEWCPPSWSTPAWNKHTSMQKMMWFAIYKHPNVNYPSTAMLFNYCPFPPSPFKSDLKVEFSSCNLQVQLQARLLLFPPSLMIKQTLHQ